MTDELKPCPFCGGKATYDVRDGVAIIDCEHCEIDLQRSLYQQDVIADSEDELLNFVVNLWNRRATPRDNAIATLMSEAYQTAKDKGWYDKSVEAGTRIALIHSELSKALEYLRNGNPPSDHIHGFSGVEEKLADTVIRVFDMCASYGFNLSDAIIEKMNYNKTRPNRHGGKAF